MLIPLPPPMAPEEGCCGLPTWSEQAPADTAIAEAKVNMRAFVASDLVPIVCIDAQRAHRLSLRVEVRYFNDHERAIRIHVRRLRLPRPASL
jgi:hypothetical protein